MSKLFVSNFHFEHELSQGQAVALPVHLERLNAELSFAWLAIAEPGDVVYCPNFLNKTTEMGATGSLPASADTSDIPFVGSLRDLPRHLEPHPWGWSKPLHDQLKRAAYSCDAPDAEIVKNLNGRDFAADLEEEFGLRPDDCYRISKIDELKIRIEDIAKNHRQWVLKARFGMSGRERMKGAGTDCYPALQNWAEKRLQRDGVLFLEPWLQIVEEVGIQFEIPKTDEPFLIGVTQLFCEKHGAFLASRFDQCEQRNNNWKRSIEFARLTATKMQSAGYFGPLGIDAIKYEAQSGEIRERPLLDINARCTMGRLSLGLQSDLHDGEEGSLIAQRKDSSSFQETKDLRSFSLSPPSLDGKPVEHRFVVVCGKSLSETSLFRS